MEWGDLGGGLIGAGLAGIGSNISDALRQRQAMQQMQELGQQIQSGDLLGAAQTAISKGNLDVGLKLYQLHHQYADEAGLGEKLTGILGGAPAAPAAPIKVGPQATLASPATEAMAYAPGITAAEGTKGNYAALGPVVTNGGAYDGDRAYGRYQVMGRNIPSWTKEILGTEMTPQEFLASPEAQDAVFKGKFMQKTSDPKDAASMWFTGRPLAQAQAAGARDQLGTTASAYVGNFQRGLGLGAAPGSQAITAAMGGGVAPDGTPVMPIAGKTPIAAPDDDTPDTGPRPLGRPTISDSPEIQGMIQRRNQLLSLMPQAKGTKYETMIPAAVQSLNDQITAARSQNVTLNKDPLEKANRAYDAENLLGFKRGSKEWKDYVAYNTRPPDKSSKTVNVKRADGSEVTMVQNDDGSFSPIPLPPAQAPSDPSMPPGADPVTWAKEKAKQGVKNDALTQASKQHADALIPELDNAIAAYKELARRNALGPVAGSGPARFMDAMVARELPDDPKLTPEQNAARQSAETLKQRYDLAISNLKLGVNPFKGQGAVSDFERKMIAASYPELTKGGLGVRGVQQLEKMKQDLLNASHTVYGSPPSKSDVGDLGVGEEHTTDDGTVIKRIK